MYTPGIETTSLITMMLTIESGLKCTSIGKNLKSEICVKVFEPPFVYTIKVKSEVKSLVFIIIYLLFHRLEVEQVSSIIHELVIIPSVF